MSRYTGVLGMVLIMFLIVAFSQKSLKDIELGGQFYEDRNSVLYPIPSLSLAEDSQ